jgi:hypothetical protein
MSKFWEMYLILSAFLLNGEHNIAVDPYFEGEEPSLQKKKLLKF